VAAVDHDRHPGDRLVRELGLFDVTMLVVASIIGAGIFLTPGTVADILPHPGLVLAAWTIGGLLSLAGALANAELAAMFPHAGGDYVYLREAYHPLAGFLVGWLSFFVIYAGTVATLAVGFADELAHFVPLGPAGSLVVPVGIIVATSTINYRGLRAGARVNNAATAVKVVALAVIAAAGLAVGNGSFGHFHPLLAGASDVPARQLGLALSPILFSYLGWNAPVYVGSEIRTPGRTIPRSLFLGLAVCTGLYLALNVVYLYALPIDVLRAAPRAGEAAARALFGPLGGRLAALLVLASVASCLHATVLVGPRIAYAMALDGLFFRGVQRVHAVRGTPHVAIVLQAVVAIAVVLLLRRFRSVLDYTTFAIVLATMADTSALYALRRRRPHQPRPYRAWGYPFVPALYLAANAGIALAMLRGRPLECLAALGVTLGALPFWILFGRRQRTGAAVGPSGNPTFD